MKRLAACALFAVSICAFAQLDPKTVRPPPNERWLSIDKTTTGYVAGGNLGGTLWAFHLLGEKMKRLGDEASGTFSIDGVVVQLRPVPRSVIKGADRGLLQAHKRYEQEHLAATMKGATFSDHDYCRGAKVPHQQWTAQRAAGGLAQAYVTFDLGDYVMMVVMPYENETRRQAVARAFEELCGSFQREKAP